MANLLALRIGVSNDPMSNDDLRREALSVAMNATCMVCGQWRECLLTVEIGWICLNCRQYAARGLEDAK